ncbi:MAG: hypothetical protein IKN81_07520 [Oscillospiraceae bacterium]|nr:hypothetical protein [Oscillospiraceae bacterium]
MVDWKYMLLAQYPACLILAVFFLVKYTFARKSSAVKSILWVLLFGVSLAVSVLFLFLGVHHDYWTLKTLFPLGVASWIGIVLMLVAVVARIVHLIEKKHSRKVMEKELKQAAKEKDAAVAEAEQAGRRAAQEEAEALRLTRAASAADAEAQKSDVAKEAAAPIELKLDE